MKLDRSRSLWPTAAIAGAGAAFTYDAGAAMLCVRGLRHCAAAPGAIEVKDQTTRRASTFASGRRRRAARIRTIAGDARWSDLVHRPEGQSARAARSRHREGAGISFKGARFRPHGLVADKSGAIWFTAQAKGYIGKLDPRAARCESIFRKARAHRSSHADLRQERRAVVHRARRQSDWAPRSVERRDRVAFPPTKDSRLTASYSARTARSMSPNSARIRSRASIQRRDASRSSCCRAKTRDRAASQRRAMATSGTRISRAAGSVG